MLNVRKRLAVHEQAADKQELNSTSRSTRDHSAAEFLERLKQGDNDAWTQLTSEWGPRLFKYLRGNLPTQEDAEDVLNETMIATVKAIPRFDGNVALSTFIYSIANRKVADFWRKKKDIAELPETLSTSGPSADNIEFREALDEIPEQSRQALLLRYHMGMSVPEVAEALGRTYKATESLLSRGRSQFKKALANTSLLEG